MGDATSPTQSLKHDVRSHARAAACLQHGGGHSLEVLALLQERLVLSERLLGLCCGLQLLILATPAGKLQPAVMAPCMHWRAARHATRPCSM